MTHVKMMYSATVICAVLCENHVWGQHGNSPRAVTRPYAAQDASQSENWRTEVKYFAEILGPGGTVQIQLGSFDTYANAEKACVDWSTSHPNDLRLWKVRESRTQVRYFPPLQPKPQPPSAPLSGPNMPNFIVGGAAQGDSRPVLRQSQTSPVRPLTNEELRRVAAAIARDNPDLVAAIRRSRNSPPQSNSTQTEPSTARPDSSTNTRISSQVQSPPSMAQTLAGTKWSFPDGYLRLYANGRYELGHIKGSVSNDRGSWAQRDGKLILNTDRGNIEEYTFDGKSISRFNREYTRVE